MAKNRRKKKSGKKRRFRFTIITRQLFFSSFLYRTYDFYAYINKSARVKIKHVIDRLQRDPQMSLALIGDEKIT